MHTENLRIATWNIKHAASADGYMGRPGQFFSDCQELGELHLDILALQEVDRHVWRSGLIDLARMAVEATGMTPYFGKAMGANLGAAINPGGEYGNLLLVNGDIVDPVDVELDGDYKRLSYRGKTYQSFREPRNAIVADVNVRAGRVAVATTHIGGRYKKQQFTEIMNVLLKREGPYIALGDLNAPVQEASRWFRRYGMEHADGPATCPMPEPYRHIDHVAVKGLKITGASSLPLLTSDHAPLIVEINFPSGS